MTDNKPWWKSKTILAALAVAIIELLGYLTESGVFEGLGLPAAAATTARNWAHLLSAALGIAIIQFRREATTTIEGTNAAKLQNPPPEHVP